MWVDRAFVEVSMSEPMHALELLDEMYICLCTFTVRRTVNHFHAYFAYSCVMQKQLTIKLRT